MRVLRGSRLRGDLVMAEGSSSSSSGEDPFLEVKAISRVLSSEATRGPDWDEEISFQNEVRAGQLSRSLSIPKADQPQTHVRHRSVQHSDSKKHLIADPPAGRPKSATFVCPAQGSGPGSAKKSPHKTKGVECNCKHESGRWGEWQQGQWSGEEWDPKRFTKKAGMCKCVAGAAADCTAVCCCPLSLLHLLALACIKLPSIMVIRTLRKVKSKLRKKQKCQDSAMDDDFGPTIPFTPSLSCKESTSEVPWAPSSGFADSRMWEEYFGTEGSIDLASH
ncbi:hypothetical protein M758_9G161100 [Ceratodon purpureus]|nr:hypothetical protein M758_9G161100 [Ceratodon purpureus]